MENYVSGYRKYVGRCRIFHDFTGLTAPLSYVYRMIFGWYSSNAPLGFKESPSHSQWISFRVTWRSSSGVSGQWKALRSSRFIRIQNPDPSHWRIFIEVRRRLQNANPDHFSDILPEPPHVVSATPAHHWKGPQQTGLQYTIYKDHRNKRVYHFP